MNKTEFIRDLNKQAGTDATKQCLVMLIEKDIPENAEISTDKSLDDVYSKMREYASNHKSGSMGCCPPDKAVEIALETFGINVANKPQAADIDIMSLL